MSQGPYVKRNDLYRKAERRIAREKQGRIGRLDLSGSSLAMLPSSLWELTWLWELNLFGNQLIGLPEAIGRFTELRDLDLAGNQLTGLPEALGNLSRLQKLDLAGNQLTGLPESLGNLSQLQTLDLAGNRLTGLPESLGNLSRLHTLDLSNNQLTGLPMSFGNLTWLWELSLAGNHLAGLPDTLGNLVRLQSLYLQRNRLIGLPNALGNLTELRELSLAENHLTSLPEALGKLAELQNLDLSGNRLTGLPEALGKLAELQKLDLSGNQVTGLPKALGNLTQLNWLDLSGNQLTELPESLRKLERLEVLLLHENPGLELPPEVLGPALTEVKGDHSKLVRPRDILNYYFSRREGERPLNEVKLLVVGRGAAGKTSLVRTALLEEPFNPREKETPGIAIAPWKAQCGKDKVTVHVWDFAGQEITHETHRFFLTERSLYLLVLDGRHGTQEEDADYWLSHVQKYGQSSPVVVALNKWHSPGPFALEKRRLQRRFPFIRGFVETDCEKGHGLENLRDTLCTVIASQEMDAVRANFPAHWFRVKEEMARLREQGQHFLPYPEYQNVCKACSVQDSEYQESLARTLHHLGIALYYGDNPRLRDTRVLVPDWAANGVYALLRGVQKRGNAPPGPGLLPGKDVGETLKIGLEAMQDATLADYPVRDNLDTHQFLLGLMLDRELCFVAEGTEGEDATYLLPELLPGDEPENFAVEEFIKSAKTRFRYRYDLLPDGVLARFIVRTHPLSEKKPRWKRGVVLAWEKDWGEDAEALVLAERRDRHVEVYLRGGTPETRQRLAGIIRANLQTIHSELPPSLNVCEELDPSVAGEQWVDVKTLHALEREHKTFPIILDEGRSSQRTADLDPTKELTPLEPASARAPDAPRARVFLSYAHNDHRYRDNFALHLDILKNEGMIEVWWDGELRAGEDWDKTIRNEIKSADIVMFLMSNPFFASGYITGVEVKLARERQEKQEAVIVPVLLDRCSLKAHTWLKTIQMLPTIKGKLLPVIGFPPNQRRGWWAVENGLRKVIADVAKRRIRRPEVP